MSCTLEVEHCNAEHYPHIHGCTLLSIGCAYIGCAVPSGAAYTFRLKKSMKKVYTHGCPGKQIPLEGNAVSKADNLV